MHTTKVEIHLTPVVFPYTEFMKLVAKACFINFHILILFVLVPKISSDVAGFERRYEHYFNNTRPRKCDIKATSVTLDFLLK